MPNMRQTMKLYYEYKILIEVATNNSIAHNTANQSKVSFKSLFFVFFFEFYGRNINQGDNSITTFFFCKFQFLLFAANIQTTVKSLPNTKMINNRCEESVEFQNTRLFIELLRRKFIVSFICMFEQLPYIIYMI